MTRREALPFIAHFLDDSLSSDHSRADLRPDARLIGWRRGPSPVFVAVQSYMSGVVVDVDDAIEIASDYLSEIGWFPGDPTEPDYVI